MYLRSSILSLLIVANIGATPQQNLWGGIGCVAGGVILAVPAVKCMIVGFGNQAYEHKKKLEELGAEVREDWRFSSNSTSYKVGYKIDYPFPCTSENREIIKNYFERFKIAYRRETLHLIAGSALTVFAGISIFWGKGLLTDYMCSLV